MQQLANYIRAIQGYPSPVSVISHSQEQHSYRTIMLKFANP